VERPEHAALFDRLIDVAARRADLAGEKAA
jgi:hypothetical protein